MSLTLHSSFKELEKDLRSRDGDENVTPDEFKHLRDDADKHLEDVPGIDARDFQADADKVVKSVERLAIAARKAKLDEGTRLKLLEAVEHQLGYVIGAYQATIQRLVELDKQRL